MQEHREVCDAEVETLINDSHKTHANVGGLGHWNFICTFICWWTGGHDTLRCLETDILRHFDRDGLSFSLKEVKMGRSAASWQTGPRLGPGCGSQTWVCNEYSLRGALHCGVTGTLEIIHISVSDNTSPHVMTRPCQLSPQQRQV